MQNISTSDYFKYESSSSFKYLTADEHQTGAIRGVAPVAAEAERRRMKALETPTEEMFVAEVCLLPTAIEHG